MSLRLCFVASSGANLFMTELLDVVRDAAATAGIETEEAIDHFPPVERDRVYVTIPHEFFLTTPPDAHPPDAALAQTIALCTEQPGTPWFDQAHGHTERMGAALDISPVGLAGLRAYGLRARRLRLGWSPLLDGWGGDAAAPRDVELLYMGSASRRREVLLSSYWNTLWRREGVRLMVPPHHAKTTQRPDFLVGDAKRALLARTQVLLSVRRQEEPYFEWVRAMDAMCNGAVLVCEHGAGHDPLVPGEHFVSGAPEHLGELADALVRDTARQQRIRRAAYEAVRAMPLTEGVAALVETAEGLRGASAHARAVPPPPAPPEPPAPDRATVDDEVEGGAERKARALREMAQRRARAREDVLARGGDPDALEVVHEQAAVAAPRVTVCIPAFRAAGVVGEAIASVAAQDLAEIELLVHDDASDDDTAQAAVAALEDHPGLAATVLRRPVNAGLPAGRNAMAHRARSPYVLMLDADNELLPPAARRLAAALDADPGATFAYGILACHRDGEPDGLLSTLPWDPELLRHYNPIDALALLRRDALLELGGYTTDERLHGWEDYELWCRVAATGGRGAHVAQMLARYRRSAGGSMLSVTDLDTAGMRAVLRELHPSVLG